LSWYIVYPAFLVILLVTGNIRVEGGCWGRQGRYAKSKLQKTTSYVEVEPLNVPQSTNTYILLAAFIFLMFSVDNAFATNVSYSVGHLTSIL
jgi:hypothetical protein